MENAIIIFVRHPESGKVKTRLAKSIGDEKALEVYQELLLHTHDISVNLNCDKFIYYADTICKNDIWENNLYIKKLQAGETLGERMRQAFLDLFLQGYSKIVIVGSDCPALTSEIIEEAFNKLDSDDVVIGPAKDGGYYLLGMSDFLPKLFENKEWSTDQVFIETIKDLERGNKKYSILVELSDIDTGEDYNNYRLSV